MAFLLAEKLLKLTPNRQMVSYALENPLKEMRLLPKTEENHDSEMKAEYFRYQEINQYLQKFIAILKKNGHENHLSNFYFKLETLTVKLSQRNIFRKIANYFFNGDASATYNWSVNEVEIFNELFCSSHEFLHAATTQMIEDDFYCGLEQINSDCDDSIGEGLNEGYTSVLDKRYFKVETGYIVEYYMAQQLEYFVGRRAMEDMYFENNLKELIHAMSCYMLEKDCITFISYLDVACRNFSANNLIPNEEENGILYYLFSFILKLHVRKHYSKIEKKNWSKEKLEQYIFKQYVSSGLEEVEYHENIDSEEIKDMLHCTILAVCEENNIPSKSLIIKKK